MSRITLNSKQQEAVDFYCGSAMVIAGAGSGKTRVITQRIEMLVEKDLAPERIVALTFTNKAAKEMKERLNFLKNKNLKKPFIGTFHSYCLFLLQRYSKYFDLETFSILDSADQQSLIKTILKNYALDKEFTPKKVLYYISAKKNGMQGFDYPERIAAKLETIFRDYEKEKEKSFLFDFDDLILKVYKKICSDEVFAQKIQSSIDHILIDEYQDTNGVQHDLIKKMSLFQGDLNIKSIFAVGDEDQSIYSWRGAIVENIEKFKQDFAPVKMIKIEQNYRSVNSILNAANQLIKNNKSRNEKNLWSDNKKEGRVVHLTVKNEYQEAEISSAFIKKIENKFPDQSIAILYRNHSQSRALEEALIQSQIAYKIVGGLRFYERKEIKDILAYLKVVVNKSDLVSLVRSLNCPNRGLGEKFLDLFQQRWMDFLDPDFDSVIDYLSQDLSPSHTRGINEYKIIFQGLSFNSSPTQVINLILERTRYFDYLKKSYDQKEAEEKIDNVKELVSSVEKFESDPENQESKTLFDFLNQIALIQESQELDSQAENSQVVFLMTLHSAKGLEFDNVIIIGLEERGLPGARALSSFEQIEEERRLFYVGMTRARQRLLMTTAVCRNEYGTVLPRDESRFVEEITPNLFFRVKNNFFSNVTFHNSLSQWIENNKIEQLFEREKITPAYLAQNQVESFFSKGKSVFHSKFGIGKIVSDCGDSVFEVRFYSGVKKISKNFLTSLPSKMSTKKL